MDRKTLKDIAYRLAVDELAEPRTNKVYHGTQTKGFLQYDPRYAYTGEGANMYGLSHYTINNPEVAKYYANLGQTPGTVLTEYIPDEKYFINPDLPFNQQSKEVQEALRKAGWEVYPESGTDYKYLKEFADEYRRLNNIPDDYDGAIKSLDAWRKYSNNINTSPLPQTTLAPSQNDLTNYRKMLNWAEKAELPGIVRYKSMVEGADPVKVFQILNPFNAEIRNPLEPVQRKYTTTDKVKPIANRIMRGFDKAAAYQQAILNRPVIQGVLNHPVTKVLGKAAGTIMKGTNIAGDAMLLYDLGQRYKQFTNQHPDYAPWFSPSNQRQFQYDLYNASELRNNPDNPVLQGGVFYNN